MLVSRKLIRTIFLSGVFVLACKVLLKIKEKIAYWRRIKHIALQLPHPKYPKEVGRSFDFQGPLQRNFPKNVVVDHKTIKRHGIQAIKNVKLLNFLINFV